MKTILLSATALALILSVPAFAAPHDHGDDHGHGTPPAAAAPAGHPGGGGHGGGGGGHTGGGGGHTGGGGGGHHDHGANPGGAGGAAIIAPPGGTMGGTHHRGHNTGGGTNAGGTTGGAAIFGGTRGGQGGRTHAGRGHNSAFDALRRAFNAPRHYRHGTYHRPNGWYAHRWNYGEFLPALFYGRSYWIDDYSDFDLSDPPPGTVWVRYGNDALLIDEDDGEVIQVVYGIFY